MIGMYSYLVHIIRDSRETENYARKFSENSKRGASRAEPTTGVLDIPTERVKRVFSAETLSFLNLKTLYQKLLPWYYYFFIIIIILATRKCAA